MSDFSSSGNIAEFTNHLIALTQPDTNTIRNAEAALKPLLKDPRCIEALLQVLENNTSPAVRHIAAILLRKRITSHYVKFQSDQQTYVKHQILHLMGKETDRSVRLGFIGAVGVLNKLMDDQQPWQELYAFIGQASQVSNDVSVQELAFLLLEELTDGLSTALEAALPDVHNAQATQILQLLHQGLVSQDVKVSAAAVKASGGMLSFLAETAYMDHPDSYASLLTRMVEVADRLKLVSEEAVGVTLDVLYDLILAHCRSVLSNLEGVLAWCVSIVTNDQLEYNVRDSAALVIATLAEVHGRKMLKISNAVPNIIGSLYNLMDSSPESAAGALFENNPLWAEELEEELGDDVTESSLTSMAQGTLDMLCLHLPGKVIYPIILQNTQARLNSPNVDARKSALACLGVAAEGTTEYLTPQLAQILPWILTGMSDAEVKVREVACFALGQLAEHCQPQILKYSNEILPALYPLLNDPNTTVQVTSCYVLEQFCERLEPKNIRSSLEALVHKLVHLLSTSSRRSIQEMSVAALSAVAVAAEEEFTVFLPNVASLILQLIDIPITQDANSNTNNSKISGQNSLRGRALECFGHMAIAVGKDAFAPYFGRVMSAAAVGLSSDDTDLHEFAYVLFANLSKVMEHDFAPVLPELVPHLLKVVESNDGALEWAENNELQQLLYLPQDDAQAPQFASLDDSDDEFDDANGNKYLTVRTAMLDAKRAAVTALGEMSRYVGPAFCPYTESTLTLFTKLLVRDENDNTNSHIYALGGGSMLQSELCEALGAMVMPAVAALGGEVQWTKGNPNTSPPLTPQVTQISDMCIRTLLHVMTSEDDTVVVGKAAESAQLIVDTLGCAVLVPLLNDAMQAVLAVLANQTPCANSNEADYDPHGEEEYVEDDMESPSSHITSVCDLIGSFARVLGDEGFGSADYLSKCIQTVLPYAKPSRSANDRAMVMGLLGEFCEALTVQVLHPQLESILLPAILTGLSDEDNNVRRNAAYLCGVTCESCGTAVTNTNYLSLLQALSPLFSLNYIEDDSSAPVMDNAAAAVARMIVAQPAQVPLAQVLPTFLSVLPLKEDMTENGTVYNCLLGLLEQNDATLMSSCKAELVRVFSEAINQEDMKNDESELCTKIHGALKLLQ